MAPSILLLLPYNSTKILFLLAFTDWDIEEKSKILTLETETVDLDKLLYLPFLHLVVLMTVTQECSSKS